MGMHCVFALLYSCVVEGPCTSCPHEVGLRYLECLQRCTPLMIAVLFLANPTQISHRLCNDHMREKPIPRLAEGAVCHTPKGEGGRYLLIQHPDRPLGGRTRKDLDVVPLVSMYASGKKYSICLRVLHNKFDELLYVLHDQGIRSSTAGVPVHTWQKSFDEVARFDGFKAARPNAMEKQERFSADAESLVAKDRGRLLPFLGGLAVFCGGEQCVLCAAGRWAGAPPQLQLLA